MEMLMATARRKPVVGKNDKLLVAVRANCGIEQWYKTKLTEMIKAMHDSMTLHISAAWKCDEPSIGFAADANPSVTLKRAMNRWGRLWQWKFNALSDEISRRFASKNFGATQTAMQASLAATGFAIKFRPTPESMEAYHAVVSSNVALIKSIPQIYLKDVANSVWASVTAGGDLSTLSKDLQKNYGVSYRRAALISRTENFKAKAVIESVRRKQLGIDQAVWLHSGGGKVPRPTHVAMSGKKFDVSKGLYDSEVQRFVFPGELISCRCTSRAVLEGYND
jgi:SPP1 gp7 family putative phage head morphogenesis protein